jgi:hypothetical protein
MTKEEALNLNFGDKVVFNPDQEDPLWKYTKRIDMILLEQQEKNNGFLTVVDVEKDEEDDVYIQLEVEGKTPPFHQEDLVAYSEEIEPYHRPWSYKEDY